MSVFFTCIILIGSSIAVVALLMILAEKKRLYDYRQDAKDRKDDLIKVIEDAELLIDEMNKFSDYVVSNFEQKNTELKSSMEEADLRIDALNGAVRSLPDTGAYENPALTEEYTAEEKDPAAIIDAQLLRKGKVIPFDVKRREIIKLAKGGLNSTQIAKLLNMGKGEIELIARMGR